MSSGVHNPESDKLTELVQNGQLPRHYCPRAKAEERKKSPTPASSLPLDGMVNIVRPWEMYVPHLRVSLVTNSNSQAGIIPQTQRIMVPEHQGRGAIENLLRKPLPKNQTT